MDNIVFVLPASSDLPSGTDQTSYEAALIPAVSIIIRRICIMKLFYQQLSTTGDRVDMSNWSCIEYCVGIICASLPHLKALIVHIIPSFFGTIEKPSRPYPSYAQQPSKSRRQTWRTNSKHLPSYDNMGGITITTTIMNTERVRGGSESQEHIIEMGGMDKKDQSREV